MFDHHGLNEKAFEFYPSLKKVRQYFETHYSAPFSLTDAAKIATLEPKHFSKLFRCKTGIGFKQWTTVVRIRMAVQLIRKGDQSLTDIAFEVGFGDYSTFERAFKNCHGLCPREFKSRLLDELADAS
jgi:AraC-like DNA-binding protein